MSNRAAYIMAAKAKDMIVKDASIPTPEAHEVVIQNYAAAVNPVDWKIQDYGVILETYPFVLGVDAAGIVHSVGSDVTKFRPGDRVLVHLDGLGNNKIENNGFQLFCKTNQALVAKLPESLSYAQGAVVPLSVSTAAAALFQKEHLGLPFPSKSAQPTGKVLLVWGGSSSMGSSAIQLAKAAGIEVATTASAHNHDYVKSLGATYVFDHSSATVVSDIVSALQGKEFAGVVDSITNEDSLRKSGEVASKLEGNKFVATVLSPPVAVPEGVTVGTVFALTIVQNGVAEAVWEKYLPQALEDGTFKAKPDPLVIGKGLEKVQEGLNKNKAGVSAQKVVIELA